MTSYEKILENICEVTEKEGRKNDDFWLSESTANTLLSEAESVKIEGDKLVLTFQNGEYISLAQESHLLYGEGKESFWVVSHAGTYNRFPFTAPKDKGISIL